MNRHEAASKKLLYSTELAEISVITDRNGIAGYIGKACLHVPGLVYCLESFTIKETDDFHYTVFVI